jgi:hypothetical protein
MLLAVNLFSAGVTDSAGSQAAKIDSVYYYVHPPESELYKDKQLMQPQRYNPYRSMGLSLVLPGAGQIYCHRRLKGSLFFLTEIGFAAFTVNRYYNYTTNLQNNITHYDTTMAKYKKLLDQSNPDLALFKKYYDNLLSAKMGYDYALYTQSVGRQVFYQAAGWFIGIYLWNVADALKTSNYFADNTSRSPTRAGLLSAIPYLGLGQIYNGSFSKAGLIWTVHTLLTFMAYNYNNDMNTCIDRRNQVLGTKSISAEIQRQYLNRWDGEYDQAFKKRNTYLWYLVLFYFYGIFDAVVDAHLHDYHLKIRLEPDIDQKKQEASLSLQATMPF